jgi:flagellar hook-length control protein FliK
MPSAVPSLFSSSALQSSAPAAKPSSPQASEGSSDFQSMLGQAKPRAQKTQNSGNADDATAKSQQADKPRQKSPVAKKGKVQAVQKKANVGDSGDEDQSSDSEATDATATQAATTPPPIADPSQAKAPAAPRKTTEKGDDDSATADASQQVLAAQSALKVQPVDAKKHQDQQNAQQQPQDASVQAIDSDEPGDAQPASAAMAPDAPPSTKNQPAPAARQPAANGSGKQQAAIQPGKASPDQAAAQSPSATAASQAADADDSSDPDDATSAATTPSAAHDTAAAHAAAHAAESSFADVLGAIQSPAAKSPATDAHGVQQTAAPTAPPEAQFAQANHSTIISGIHGQLLPAGGTMQVRLDPPELGALSVIVRVHEGVMSASFETSNDQATRMLSHTLTQLKSSLEAQGVSVGKLHVQQSPKGQQSDLRDENRSSQDHGSQDSAAQREQQRREMLRRMWRRLSGGQDPLDLVA